MTTEIALEEAAEGGFQSGPDSVAAASPEPETETEPESERESETESQSESGSVRSGLGQMFEGVVGSFAAVAFNGAQILIVLVTVFFGVIYTLMNPRPIFGPCFRSYPLVTTIKP